MKTLSLCEMLDRKFEKLDWSKDYYLLSGRGISRHSFSMQGLCEDFELTGSKPPLERYFYKLGCK